MPPLGRELDAMPLQHAVNYCLRLSIHLRPRPAAIQVLPGPRSPLDLLRRFRARIPRGALASDVARHRQGGLNLSLQLSQSASHSASAS